MVDTDNQSPEPTEDDLEEELQDISRFNLTSRLLIRARRIAWVLILFGMVYLVQSVIALASVPFFVSKPVFLEFISTQGDSIKNGMTTAIYVILFIPSVLMSNLVLVSSFNKIREESTFELTEWTSRVTKWYWIIVAPFIGIAILIVLAWSWLYAVG